MLAICSDLDETRDRQAYRTIVRFLNTTDTTPMGPGVGLEIGNTIYFDMPPDQFAYWNTDDDGREMVRSLIHSGHVDCLHSFGDLATTRAHAARALDELARHDCHLKVWVDHGTAPTNFDPGIMKGHGDEVGHDAYHADLTTAYGIRHVWRGRVTSVIGQDRPSSLRGLWTPRHPIASARTLAKEAAKRRLARGGDAKYAMHGPNRAVCEASLRDGSCILEFLRCNPHWGGVSRGETGREIGQVLTDRFLNRLVEREGVCILYTHLGKVRDSDRPFDETAVAGFRRLADYVRQEKILVTTTRRAVRYLAVRDTLTWTTSRRGDRLIVDLRADASKDRADLAIEEEDLAGLTFVVPGNTPCDLTLSGKALKGPIREGRDPEGRRTVTVPIKPLVFPQP